MQRQSPLDWLCASPLTLSSQGDLWCVSEACLCGDCAVRLRRLVTRVRRDRTRVSGLVCPVVTLSCAPGPPRDWGNTKHLSHGFEGDVAGVEPPVGFVWDPISAWD